MDINTLSYFVTLADTLNFTKAAKIHFISQTTMSRQIANLEETLGVKLILRNTSKAELTYEGKKFYEDIKVVLNDYAYAVKHVKNIAFENSILRIGFSDELEREELIEIIKKYQALENNIAFHIESAPFSDLVAGLKSWKYDLIFTLTHVIIEHNDFESFTVFEYPVVIGVGAEHPLSNRKCIHANELENETIIVPEICDSIDQYNYIMSSCKEDGYIPQFISVNSINDQKAMISLGKGVAFFPNSEKFKQINPQIKFIDIKNTCHKYSINLAWKKSEDRSDILNFIKFCQNMTLL